jgi:ABC-2 type transport system ATP-binding protein
MIELCNLTKRFGSIEALKDVSLVVEDGEVFGFLGPNGAGKTTALRIMAGLLRPTSGGVMIDHHDMWQDPLKAKALVGVVPDRPYLYGKLTAVEFLEFLARIRSLEMAESQRRIHWLIELFGLSEWKDELVEQYSHGMRQRLAFASALLHRPRALIIDEPMVGLDPSGATLIKEIFKEEASKRGTTVILSTHQIHVAQQVCHRIAILDKGEVIALGSPEEMIQMTGRPDLESVFLQLTGTPGGLAEGMYPFTSSEGAE